MSQFDWKNPDYTPVYAERYRRLQKLRTDPSMLPAIKKWYSAHPADFINDWALTVDPRVKGRSPVMPFLLFPRQIEAIDWIDGLYARGEPGIMVKSRDVGASWIAVAWAVTKCLFTSDFMVGVGSAKEDKIDRSGDPDTLFYKARMFLQNIPVEFRGGWELGKHSAHMRLTFPQTGASITGEAGDNIGRGGRKSVYFVDEAAHVERPMLIDASLAATTECRIDMSSVNTMANSFATRAHSIAGPQRFDFTWADDPRKDADWLAKKKRDLDPVVFKQEVLCDFNATVDNAVIPSDMIAAAIGLAERLGIRDKLMGPRRSALDIADVGRDKCALASGPGNILDFVRSWSGAEMDISESVSKAVALVEELGGKEMSYDADGMGANVRGDVRVMNEIRKEKSPRSFTSVRVVPFRGSGEVLWPLKTAKRSEVKNEDMFQNYKAQAWWHLYTMFAESLKASKGEPYDIDLVISIDPGLPELSQLTAELGQPKWKWMTTGKRVVDKMPDGSLSPNNADAVMMRYAPRKGPWAVSDEAIAAMSR